MKGLSMVGTAAMFMVGGGIISHGIPSAQVAQELMSDSVAALPWAGGLLMKILPTLFDALIGILTGAIVLVVVSAVKRLVKKNQPENVKMPADQ